MHLEKTDFAGEEAVDSGDYQAGVMYSNGIMMSRLFPRKVIMSHGKPM